MVDKLDPEVERFINHRIHSPLDVGLIIYFNRNLITVESPRKIAKHLRGDVKRVAKILRRFESRGIIRNMATGESPLYVYSASNNLHLIIKRFVKLVSSRQGREIVDNKLIINGKL